MIDSIFPYSELNNYEERLYSEPENFFKLSENKFIVSGKYNKNSLDSYSARYFFFIVEIIESEKNEEKEEEKEVDFKLKEKVIYKEENEITTFLSNKN